MTETKSPYALPQAIAGIAKNDTAPALRAFQYPPDHPAMTLWSDPASGLIARLQQWMSAGGIHPGRTLVLLPYAQLLPLARRVWSQHCAQGFAPRFETTSNWLASLGDRTLQATDISFDVALDTLTAQHLLAGSGMPDPAGLAGLLVETAHQLATYAAAAGLQGRSAWVQEARRSLAAGMDGPALAWEARVLQVAVEWAAVSAFDTDMLFDEAAPDDWDAIALVQGLAVDPVATALQVHWGSRARLFMLDASLEPAEDDLGASPAFGSATPVETALPPVLRFHACQDAEDEAQRAAACAMAHVAADRFPVALVSSDRALTRRVRAMLEGAGIAMRDENGWKLSTSRAGAALMAVLKASVWNASTDAVLNAFKLTPALQPDMQALEQLLRKEQVRDWRQVPGHAAIRASEVLRAHCARIEAIRAKLQGTRTLPAWLVALQSALVDSGLWEPLGADEAGASLLSALRLVPPEPQAWAEYTEAALWAGTRRDLPAFTAWVNQVLEAHSFQPPYPDEEQVVILPMSQMLARPFASVVLAGCDEVRLPPSPEPAGLWTPTQRAALGMPSRQALEARLRASWGQALRAPACDVLWRTSDDAGEHIAPSALVQSLQLLLHDEPPPHDPRVLREITAAPALAPLPRGDRLPVTQLSASAYDDLRTCPYRFFALRQLGLKSVDELDAEVDKREFGVWLHAVLQQFHASLAESPCADRSARSALLQRVAEEVMAAMHLPEGEFLPFEAAWPQVREGYLQWLDKHEAQGWTFSSGETAHTQVVGTTTLVGRIDRTDRATAGEAGGGLMVLDYKTEPSAKTKARVKNALEDTQIAFYAALLPEDSLRAAYINVGEREGTELAEQKDIVAARDALIEGIVADMERIAQGHALPALGEGAACDYCQARGLCRKDFWSQA